jgi:LysR family glycine cleavage system transcriptional activator
MPRIGVFCDKYPDIELELENVTIFQTDQLSREAARAGLGISVIPAPIAEPHIGARTFVALCYEENSAAAYHILTRPEVVSPQRDVFVRWLKDEAAI